MSLFSKLFGGGGGSSKPDHASVTYKDFTITPEPIPADGQHRLAARITKEIGGETKSHHLIRADTLASADAAADAAIDKAKIVIDQQGDRLFN